LFFRHSLTRLPPIVTLAGVSEVSVKPIRPSQAVIAEVETILESNRPAFHHSPLEEVAGALTSGRRYSWVGIYLTINRKGSATLIDDSEHLGKLASANAQRKILVSIRIAGREIGFLSVESDRANAFGSEDRVLLERVAGLLARFLSGKGKYLVRRAGQPSPVPKAAAA